MWQRDPETEAAREVRLTFEGREILAREGETLAAALLAAGVTALGRNPVSGAPRGPYCLMGICFECLVEIDGAPNRQACMTEVREGMVVTQALVEDSGGGR